MRSESSVLPLHHIKTTVFTVVLVLPYSSEPVERTGIVTTNVVFRFSVGSKKRLSYSVVLVLPCISEHAERTEIELIDSNELSGQKTEPVQYVRSEK